MAEHIYLTGAEDVQRAGRQMQDAAAEISRAVANFELALHQFVRQAEELVARVEAVGEAITRT